MNDEESSGIEMRRSQRVVLRLPIQVRWTPQGDSAITEETVTLVVNAHGALISLAMKVKAGSHICEELGRDGGQRMPSRASTGEAARKE